MSFNCICREIIGDDRDAIQSCMYAYDSTIYAERFEIATRRNIRDIIFVEMSEREKKKKKDTYRYT